MNKPARPDHWKIDAAGASIFFVLTLLAWLLVFQPANDRWARIRASRADLASAHERASRLSESVRTLRDQVNSIEQALARRPLNLRTADQINGRIAELTELALRRGLRIDEINPGKASSEPRFDLVPIELTGTGTYPNCTRFLAEIRSTYSDMSVGAFDIRTIATPATTAVFRIKFIWYTRPALPVAGAN